MQSVKIAIRRVAPLMILDLDGAVTGSADEALRTAYANASAEAARDVLLNFGGVDHMDSTGISVIIALLTEARQRQQRLMITGLSAHYRKIFDFMGLAQYAPVFESEEAALAWITQHH